MMLSFEKWIERQSFDENVLSLFKESIICYKTNAYRASLLLSYLGFMSILKKRILNSEPPTNFNLIEWQTEYQKKLQNEDSWDAVLFDFTQQEKAKGGIDKKVFDISTDLREQIKYWKNRRNDCAHAKDQYIDYFHIETFWAFLQSNLPKLVVGGGKEFLLNQIKYHFDTSLTPNGLDYDFIIENIQHTIHNQQLKTFFNEVEIIIKGFAKGASSSKLANRYLEFFNKVLSNCPNYIKEELIIYIKSDESRLVEFLTAYPSKITELKLESSFIRSFWSKQGKYIDDRHFPIILSMIRNKLILDIEIDEVKDVLLKKAAFYKMNIQAKELLENIGFFDLFKKEYVNGNAITDYEIGNRLSSLFIFYLDNYTIEKEIVQTIYNTLRQKNYPYDLCKDLTDFFKKKPDKKAEFIKYLSANEINSFSTLIENNELF